MGIWEPCWTLQKSCLNQKTRSKNDYLLTERIKLRLLRLWDMVFSEEERILLSYFLCHSLSRERPTGASDQLCKVAHTCAACPCNKSACLSGTGIRNQIIALQQGGTCSRNSCWIENKDESSSIKDVPKLRDELFPIKKLNTYKCIYMYTMYYTFQKK